MWGRPPSGSPPPPRSTTPNLDLLIAVAREVMTVAGWGSWSWLAERIRTYVSEERAGQVIVRLRWLLRVR